MSDLKQYYSAAELAEMKIAGLPKSDRRIRTYAEKNLWVSRPKVRGKGLEYQPPKTILQIIQKRQLEILLKSAPAAAEKNAEYRFNGTKLQNNVTNTQNNVIQISGLTRRVKGEDNLTDKDRDRRDASLILCRAIEEAVSHTNCSIKRAIIELAPRILNFTAHQDLIKAANITYTKPRAGGQTEAALISRLQKMMAAYQQGKLSGDVGRYLVVGSRQKDGHSPLLVKAFLLHYCHPSRPPITEAWRNSEAWFYHHGLERPAIDTFYRIEKDLPVTLKYRGRVTGSEWRALMPYVARDVSMFKANDIWVGDGHTFKAKIQHPIHGQPFSPEVTVIIDWVSRKIVGWSVDLAESTIAVSAALRHAQQQTGARCLVYYSDNGGGQIGKHIDHEVTGTLARQGIAHETGIPGNPQGRGIIERLWQTTTIPLARTYPTCIWRGGDKEVTRKVLVALNKKDGTAERLLPSFSQFIEDLDNCITDYNTQHEHRELFGRTPEQEYQLKLDQDSIDLGITEAELNTMWMPEELRIPQRGIISLFNNEYANKELVNLLAEGEKVRVRFDIHNAHKVWLYRIDGRYLGEAIWDGHKHAAFPVPFIELKRQERADGKIKRGERIIKEAKAELGNTIDGEVLQTFDFPIANKTPDLVPVELTEKPKDEELSYADTMQWLYGEAPKEAPKNEVAAAS